MKLHFLLLFFALTSSSFSFADSISVSPGRLDFYVDNDYAEKQLVVFNGNHEERVFNIEPEDFPGWFEFERKQISIKPGKFEQVKIRSSPPFNGKYSTRIVIFPSYENGSNVGIQIGAIINTSINVVRPPNTFVGVALSSSIILIGTASYFLVRRSLFKPSF